MKTAQDIAGLKASFISEVENFEALSEAINNSPKKIKKHNSKLMKGEIDKLHREMQMKPIDRYKLKKSPEKRPKAIKHIGKECVVETVEKIGKRKRITITRKD